MLQHWRHQHMVAAPHISIDLNNSFVRKATSFQLQGIQRGGGANFWGVNSTGKGWEHHPKDCQVLTDIAVHWYWLDTGCWPSSYYEWSSTSGSPYALSWGGSQPCKFPVLEDGKYATAPGVQGCESQRVQEGNVHCWEIKRVLKIMYQLRTLHNNNGNLWSV